ncbi:hypothetical protein PoB_004141000 [Plakobranchus ocellatus]|uniref:Uncharacterized protein n=1 Tax=Plakobranchus ocellatus TaxID=259542 RepID=A0AAV4B2R0_9GAST|nr:hypothetical protein PoB_004141000 [Plakobranchus ocellatus]
MTTQLIGSIWRLELLWVHNIPNTVRNGHESHIESNRRQCRSHQSRWWMYNASPESIHRSHHRYLPQRRQDKADVDALICLNVMVQNGVQAKEIQQPINKERRDEATIFTVAEQ